MNSGWFRVQRLLLPAPHRPAELYFREAPRIEQHAALQPDIVSSSGLIVRTAQSFKFDTLANSFFEGWWRRYSLAKAVELKISVTGNQGWLRLSRVLPDESVIQLDCCDVVDGRRDYALRAEFLQPGGMLVLDVGCIDGEVVVHGGDWSVQADCDAVPSLMLCYCTFNRAEKLALTIDTIARDADLMAVLAGIVIVSQGSDTAELVRLIEGLGVEIASKVRIIQQPNLGGSGGFARAMLETGVALNSYCCLMDDDIEVEPDCLLRALWFKALAREDLCVGGQMLELERPSMLFESGNKVHLDSLSVINEHTDINAADGGSIRHLSAITEKTYNGWWFFLFDPSLLERVGFPMPMFLHGDDVEFGMRLLEAGVPTVTMPGIYVWHEAPNTKVYGTMPYYDVRNLLIIRACKSKEGFAAPLRELRRRLHACLALHDYGQAGLIRKAVDDFLAGPNTLTEQAPEAVHRQVQQRLEQDATVKQVFTRGVGIGEPLSRKKRSTFTRATTAIRRLLAPVATTPVHWRTVGAATWLPDSVASKDHYLLIVNDSPKALAFSRSRRSLWWSLGSSVSTCLRFAVGYHKAAQAWADAMPALIDKKFLADQLARAAHPAHANGQAAHPSGTANIAQEKSKTAHV